MSDINEDEFELDLTSILADKDSLKEPQQILLVGEAGHGKTTLAMSASKVEGLAPVLYIDTEGSTVGIANKFPDVDVVHADSYAKLKSVIDAVTSGKTHKYKTVVIDTLDAAQELALKKFQKDNPRDGYAAWGQIKDLFTGTAASGGWLHKLKAAPFLSILVVHAREEKAESGAVIQKVLLQGAAKDIVPSIPDVVGFVTRMMKSVEGQKAKVPVPSLITVPTKQFDLAKTRFELPPVIDNVTMQAVYDEIRKSPESEEN